MSTKESSVSSSDSITKWLQLRRDYFSGFCPEQLQTFKVFVLVRTVSYLKILAHEKEKKKGKDRKENRREGGRGEKHEEAKRQNFFFFFFLLRKS